MWRIPEGEPLLSEGEIEKMLLERQTEAIRVTDDGLCGIPPRRITRSDIKEYLVSRGEMTNEEVIGVGAFNNLTFELVVIIHSYLSSSGFSAADLPETVVGSTFRRVNIAANELVEHFGTRTALPAAMEKASKETLLAAFFEEREGVPCYIEVFGKRRNNENP